MTTEQICTEISRRLETIHIKSFKGMEKPLLLISDTYPGVWLEHVYDSVFYAKLDPAKLYLAENTIELFLSLQKDDGQFPCYIWDGNKVNCPTEQLVGYSQIQECVSFASLCLEVYRMNGDRTFLRKVYDASEKWADWLRKNRMTTGRDLVEMFYGFDTGHDNSGRLCGMSCHGNYGLPDGTNANAATLPPDDGITPIIAVDMNCNFYGTLTALSKMAHELGLESESAAWMEQARKVKKKLFEVCYDEEDAFFYDVDRNGNKRRFLSSTIFHLFMEGVLDKEEDKTLIDEIYTLHISNPAEFATPYPYPSMAVNDPSCRNHKNRNCWGYFTQGLIALRATLWMEGYGFEKEFDYLCRQWVKAWTEHYDELKLGQELDPITGVPSESSEWYSSCMLFYLFAARKINQ